MESIFSNKSCVGNFLAGSNDDNWIVANIEELIMKIFKFGLLFLLILVGVNKKVMAQGTVYKIENLESKLSIQKDYSLLVETTIDVNFTEKKQGIVWYVPYSEKESDKGKVESQNKLKILSITDGKGELLPYKVEYFDLNKKITIGDANKSVIGKHIYRIKYLRREIVKETDNHMEIWWSLVGNYRNAQVDKTSMTIESPYFKILKTEVIKTGSIVNHDYDLKIESARVSLNFNSPIQPADDLVIKTSFEKATSFLDNKKSILYTSLLALVMISTAVMIQKRD